MTSPATMSPIETLRFVLEAGSQVTNDVVRNNISDTTLQTAQTLRDLII